MCYHKLYYTLELSVYGLQKRLSSHFTALTQLTEMLEKTDRSTEYLEMPHLLRAIQKKGKEACIANEG